MRILNVSFKNINSLAGEWKIDFTHPDYNDYGIFLIAGPTGAGKTSILDAITLALYGRTPRVPSSGATCECMTRDAKDCRAEVVFETPAGRFRSYWGRNRKKDGSLNLAKREFENLETGQMETKIDEINKLRQANNILDYDQFIRAVLLAQGDFKKFLDSNDDEKSAILQNLTDSAIYEELSLLAFEKEKEERKIKENIQEKYDAIKAFSDEELVNKKREATFCEAAINQFTRQEQECQNKINWLEKLQALKAEVKKLEEDKNALLIQVEQFKPKNEKLLAAERAREFEPAFARLEYMRKDINEKNKRYTDSEARLQNLLNDLRKSGMEKSLASQKEEKAQNILEQTRPLIEHARRLDADIAVKREELDKSQTILKESVDKYDKFQSEYLNLKQDREKNLKELSQVIDWLEVNKADAWLVENRNELKARIKNQALLAEDIKKGQIKLADQEKELAKIDKQISEKQKKREEKEIEKKANVALAADLKDSLHNLLNGKTLSELEKDFSDAQKKLIDANKFLSMEDHRKNLAPGQACPLCGSLDHPYLDGYPSPDVDNLRIKLNSLEKNIADVKSFEERLKSAQMKGGEIDHVLAMLDTEENALKSVKHGRESDIEESKIKLEELAKRQDLENAGIRGDLEKIGLGDLNTLDGLSQILEQRFMEWRRNNDKKEAYEKNLSMLEPKLSASDANWKNSEVTMDAAKKRLTELEEIVESLKRTRTGIIDGKNADVEEKTLKNDLAQAKKEYLTAEKKEASIKAEYDKESGQLQAQKVDLEKLKPELESLHKEFLESLSIKNLTEELFLQSRLSVEEISSLRLIKEKLDKEEAEISRLLGEKNSDLKREMEKDLTDKNLTELDKEKGEINLKREACLEEKAKINAEISENESKIKEKEQLGADYARQSAQWEKWKELNFLIGSSDGKKFRSFAQNLTLDILLDTANQQLSRINDRYILQRKPNLKGKQNQNLEIEVVDRYLGDKVRPTSNLSGGESFIVSLALALGLASMAGKNATLGSLFLDEGFGALDEDTLKTAIKTISDLSNEEGKLIGIISHVEALRHKSEIPTHIEVEPDGRGMSGLKGPGVSKG